MRFTPTVMDVDETSKLWGMLHQTPYSLSVVYQASLVLIEGREEPVPAEPVRERTVRVLPFGTPGAPVPPGTEPPAAVPAAGDTAGADSAPPAAPAEPGTRRTPRSGPRRRAGHARRPGPRRPSRTGRAEPVTTTGAGDHMRAHEGPGAPAGAGAHALASAIRDVLSRLDTHARRTPHPGSPPATDRRGAVADSAAPTGDAAVPGPDADPAGGTGAEAAGPRGGSRGP
ncbi:Pvc16 family protein [Streptomyces zhihengii]